MKKSSMIFKMICMAVCFALCLSVLPAIAEDAAIEETVAVDEIVENVTEAVEETTENAEEVTDEVVEETTDEAVEESTEEASDEVAEETTDVEDEAEEEATEEVLDLYATTLRDKGVFVTPGEHNATVFDYDGVRYRVLAGMDNIIRLDGFESNHPIEENEIAESVKYKLYVSNGGITVDAAHSDHFGLSVSGKVVYRVPVTYDMVYVFSAWVKMPGENSVSENNRDFTVVSVTSDGEIDEEYIVGYNEIGRDIDWEEDSWQQVLFTFRAPVTGLFQIDFSSSGSAPLYLDDVELYEAEVFENPIKILETICTDADGNTYTRDSGFTTAGTLEHKVILENTDEDEVFFKAVMALYKNNIVEEIKVIEDIALPLDETEVTISVEIPEDADHTQYKYLVYFIDDTEYTKYYGYIPSRTNPFEVQGK